MCNANTIKNIVYITTLVILHEIVREHSSMFIVVSRLCTNGVELE